MNVKVVAIFALDTIGSVLAQAKFVSRVSLSEWNGTAGHSENGENGTLAYGNKNGKGAGGRLDITRVGMKHGTNEEDGESKDIEIATVALRHGERGDGMLAIARVGIQHGRKRQDAKSKGVQIRRVTLTAGPGENLVCLRTHGWQYRTSRMRCLF